MAGTNLQPVKLFSDRSHYDREHRTQLSDLLRPYWKDAQFNEEQRGRMYGLSRTDFVLVPTLADADVAVLPMTWNHYLARRELPKAAKFIGAARRAARPILSYNIGDEGVAVPAEFDDVWMVRASGFRSRRRDRQVAQPVFFDDPLKQYEKDDGREGEAAGMARGSRGRPPMVDAAASRSCAVPAVGFCGQAGASALKLAVDVVRGIVRLAAHRAGLRQREPQPIYPPSLLRSRALRILRRSHLVRSDFIIRTRYRAGAVGTASIEKTSREFYDNITRTDYTLCVRGGGNFSKRLYETLAMGRIPLLVDTDCLLPLEPLAPWPDVIVRAPSDSLRSLPRKVVDHFARHPGPDMAGLKERCRKFWEDSLSFRGFHCQLIQIILDSAVRAGGSVGGNAPAIRCGNAWPAGTTVSTGGFS